MTTWLVGVASCCAAGAAWLRVGRTDADAGSRLRKYGDDGVRDGNGDEAGASWTVLILRMVQVALQQGASIPRALEAVGRAAGGDCGIRMERVGAALNRGASWDDAWKAAAAEDDGPGRRRASGGRSDDVLPLLCATLASSWKHGDAPGVRIEAAIEQLDRDERSLIERNAARLSVKLLMPTGLCFLPAFVLIGVIPAIVSFVM
ncbi:type II secretion system F family protein [Bifidobacterium sp. 82T25]|nr:type II secretion system F family protein [Bifidobacterium miconisargentati]